ncbi:MAG: hypothetical protein QNJ98_16135 [Planctomycetota bacterium]|nr:hypothetical protein [Planctomycetota bacterium]
MGTRRAGPLLLLILGLTLPAAADEATWPASWSAPAPRTGDARTKALRAGGGTSSSEALAKRGLDWLAAHQDEDGKLDADGFMRHDPEDDRSDGAGGGHHGERVPCAYDGVTTALSLMAWLADGSTPEAGPYAANVKPALRWCVAYLRGGFSGFDAIWNYTLCMQAVADAYRVTGDKALRPVLEAAVRALLTRQLTDGGWRYFGRVGGVPSTSFAGVALGQCAQAGIAVPKDRVEQLLRFLDARVDAKTGRSEYHDRAERLGYTPTVRNAASALAARAMLGVLADTPGLAKQIGAIKAKSPRWKISFKKLKAPDGTMREFQIGNLDPYAWYFTTMALADRGGGAWSSWFGALKKALKKGQRKDGAAAGSWDPLGNYSNSGGRVFVTAMCVLMLQAPYRNPR